MNMEIRLGKLPGRLFIQRALEKYLDIQHKKKKMGARKPFKRLNKKREAKLKRQIEKERKSRVVILRKGGM
jgi:hypothetical protein